MLANLSATSNIISVSVTNLPCRSPHRPSCQPPWPSPQSPTLTSSPRVSSIARVSSVKSSIGIFTHQGHISQVVQQCLWLTYSLTKPGSIASHDAKNTLATAAVLMLISLHYIGNLHKTRATSWTRNTTFWVGWKSNRVKKRYVSLFWTIVGLTNIEIFRRCAIRMNMQRDWKMLAICGITHTDRGGM